MQEQRSLKARKPMFTCHYYVVAEPLQEDYKDDSEHRPQHTIIVPTRRQGVTLSFFGDDQTISMMRISLPSLPEENLSSEDLEAIQLIKEHAYSILRLMYDKDLTFYPLAMWWYQEQEKPLRFHVNLQQMLARSHPSYDAIEAGLLRAFPQRIELRLFVDALDLRLPLQFRYLSLYKILELTFKTGKKWLPAYRQFLLVFETEYRGLCISPKSLFSHIIDLRDRCAHVKMTGGMFGVTMLSSKDAGEVGRMLPLMLRICSRLLNDRGSGVVLMEIKPLAASFDPATGQWTPHEFAGHYALGFLVPSASPASLQQTGKASKPG